MGSRPVVVVDGPEIPPTAPHPVDYPNRPWSLPPCPNTAPDGTACVSGAHTIVDGVRSHWATVTTWRLLEVGGTTPTGRPRRRRYPLSRMHVWHTRETA